MSDRSPSASGISRFFLPKGRENKKNARGEKKSRPSQCPQSRKKGKKSPLEGWEKPVGLLREYAIEIDDDEEQMEESRQESVGPIVSVISRTEVPSESESLPANNGLSERRVPFQTKLKTSPVMRKETDTDPSQISPDEPPKKAIKSNFASKEYGDIQTQSNDGANNLADGDITSMDFTAPTKNPFSTFACDLGGAEASYFGGEGQIGFISKEGGSLEHNTQQQGREPVRKTTNQVVSDLSGSNPILEHDLKEAERKNRGKNGSKHKKKKSKTPSEYIPVDALPHDQKMKICLKWQSFGDPNADLEVRRFQVLVAARLHAQSREPVVRAAISNLQKYFSSSVKEDKGHSPEERKLCGMSPSKGHGLCVEALSKADPEKEIAPIISSILFANVKARQIVQAAKEIKTRFGGRVPETKHGLQQITGIGPTLADILSFCNSAKSYLCSETLTEVSKMKEQTETS